MDVQSILSAENKSTHAGHFMRLPVHTGANGQSGDDKTDQADGERPRVGAGRVEEIAADPGAEGAAKAETDFQKTENEAGFAAGKNITDDRTVYGITRAMADGHSARLKFSNQKETSIFSTVSAVKMSFFIFFIEVKTVIQ